MTTATTPTAPPTLLARTPPPQDTARVSLVPSGGGRTRLDGAWWPRSRDLPAELPGLIAALDRRFGRISRVTVNRALWPQVPRRAVVNGRTVHAGWFDAEQDPHVICALDGRGGRWDLLVVPPDSPPAGAARLMAGASRPGNDRTAAELLATAGQGAGGAVPGSAPAAARQDAPAESVWESEGGTRRTPVTGPLAAGR